MPLREFFTIQITTSIVNLVNERENFGVYGSNAVE